MAKAGDGGKELVAQSSVAAPEEEVETGNDVPFHLNSKVRKGLLRNTIVVTCLLVVVYFIIYLIDSVYATSLQLLVSYIFFALNVILMVIVAYYYYVKEKATKQKKMKFTSLKTLKFFKKKIGMFRPAVTHFADTASDIAVLIEFYDQSINKNNRDSEASKYIEYNYLFYATLGVLIFYRFLSTIIIYLFSKSWTDAMLQFWDFYIFKVIKISMTLDLSESSYLQKYIQYLEALFESAPQLLVAAQVVVVQATFTDKISPSVAISCIFSLLTLVNRCIQEDTMILNDSNKFKELNFKKNKKAKKLTGKISCNGYFVFRVFWRFMDVTGWFSLLTLFWLCTSGPIMLSMLGIGFVLTFIWPMVNIVLFGESFDIFLFNAMLQTPLGSYAMSVTYSIVRVLIQLGIIIYILAFKYDNFIAEHSELLTLFWLTVVFLFLAMLYAMIMWNSCFHIGGCGIKSLLPYAMTQWNSRDTAERSLLMCQNMEDVEHLLAFGYQIRKGAIICDQTWCDFDDPLALMLWFEDNLKERFGIDWSELIKDENFQWAWEGILGNEMLSTKYDVAYWNQLCEKGNCVKHVNGDKAIFGYCTQFQSNVEFIKLLVEKYNARVTKDLVKDYAMGNVTEGKQAIVEYLEMKAPTV